MINNKKEKRKRKTTVLPEEENILYEVLVSNEWQEPEVVLKDDVVVKKVLGSARPNSRWFRPLSFSPNVYVPNSVKRLIDLQVAWQLAIGEQGKAVAILQEISLEIRTSKDDYSSVVGKATIGRDAFPQWRKMCWSGDCSLLAVARSNGDLEVFDLLATKLFSINKTFGSIPCRVDCVVDVAFVDCRIKKTRWSSELVACNFKGTINSYYVNCTDTYQEATNFTFSNRYPNGVTAFCCHSEHQLVLVGGMRMENADEAQTHTLASHYEITAWRILNDEPHYRIVTAFNEDGLKPTPSRSLLKFMPTIRFFQAMKEEAVFKLRVSPNGQKLAAIHTSGSLSVWEIPSLRLFRLWHLGEQPGYNAVNTTSFDYGTKRRPSSDKDELAFHLIDINWWSDNALILGRCCGSVTISSILTLKNLLGNSCEWFEPMPQFSAACDKKFLALECETQINPKKRASIDEDSIEESSDEENYIFKKPTKLMKKALYYMTDSEKFQPPRKRTKVLNKTYRLVCLKSTTPEELYRRKMDMEEYGEALALARTYDLDADLVYQRQWKKATVSIASIQDYLSKIQKRSWVLHECLERVSDNVDAAQELLEYGIEGTDLRVLVKVGKGEDDGRFSARDEGEDDAANNDDDDDDNGPYNLDECSHRMQKLFAQIDFNDLTLEQKQLLLARRKLLAYLARLDTYRVMLGGPHECAQHFDAKFFQSFRSKSAVDAAVEFARDGDYNRVHVMLTYHGDEVLEHWLAILSNFPETTDPYEYRNVLAECAPDRERVYEWERSDEREQDWCQDVRCRNAVGEIYPETTLYENSPELARFRTRELTPALLSAWYNERALEIEKRTLFVDCALELVKLGREKNIEGLDELYEDLLTLETLVYECRIECTLSEYRAKDDVAKAELLMSTATDDVSYVKQFRRWLLPFVDRREARHEGRKLEILRAYMLAMAESDLSRCLLVCQNSRSELPNAIIAPASELIDIALSCAYACTASDQLSVANCILECLPSRNYGPETPTMLKLHDWIDEFESDLSAAFILQRHGVSATLPYIRKCRDDVDLVHQLLIKLTRKRSAELKEQKWWKLLDDILELQKILRCISPNDCHEIFVSSLLRSGNCDNIKLTEKLMECSANVVASGKKVGYERAVKLTLEAAREYFDSSSSLSDASMDLSKSCLNLMTDKPKEIEMELDLIAALVLLKELSVAVLPLQVRLCKDRIQLIEMALQSRSKAYTRVWKLVKLADLMRVSGDDKRDRDGRVLELAADSAFLQEDYNACWNLCRQLIEQDHSERWQICERLGRCDKFTNLRARQSLLSYAAIYCSIESIESLIRSRNILELQSLNQHLRSQMDESKANDDDFGWTKTREFTQQMLRATGHVTKSVVSQMVTKQFWNRTDRTDIETNGKLERQGCCSFYADVVRNGHSSETSSSNPALRVVRNLLRAALLAETVADALHACLDSAVLCKLAECTLSEDCALGLAYLLALPSMELADSCLNSLPKSDISLQLSCYYFALQLLFRVSSERNYSADPDEAIERALSRASDDQSVDDDLSRCTTLLKQHHETLADMLQGQVLHRLGRGVDVVRFSLDPQYKTNTILGLAMTLDDDVYETAVSLAARYDIPSLQVYLNHLQFLFSEVELNENENENEIEKRVNRSQLVPRLSQNSSETIRFFTESIYPAISGVDHARLLYYYQLLEKCGCKSVRPRARLLRKVKSIAPELDFKRLVESSDPLTTMTPCLTKDNVHAFAKLASQLTSLNQSRVYCAWIQKMFYQTATTTTLDRSTAAWLLRYEECAEFVQKLHARDVSAMATGLCFGRAALDNLPLDARQEICCRVLEYSKQECIKTSDEAEKGEWEKCARELSVAKRHLEWRGREDVESASRRSELSKYVDRLDMSISVAREVRRVLKDFVVDGNSIASLQELASICPPDTYVAPADVVNDALHHVVDELKFSDPVDTDTGAVVFNRFRTILNEIQRHLSNGEDSLLVEDVVSTLRPFCSDASVDVNLRLGVLQELERAFTLDADDARLATLYRARVILAVAWPHLAVTDDDVASVESRRSLIDKLVPDCLSTTECAVVIRLLSSWKDIGDDAWCEVLRKLLNCPETDRADVFVSTFRAWPADRAPLMPELTAQLLSHVPDDDEWQINRCKFLLLTKHRPMHDEAIRSINDNPATDLDEEILQLLLDNKLTTHVVDSPAFAALTGFLLDRPDDVDAAVADLRTAGFDFEAGSLLLRNRSSPAALRNFRSAAESLKYLKMVRENETTNATFK